MIVLTCPMVIETEMFNQEGGGCLLVYDHPACISSFFGLRNLKYLIKPSIASIQFLFLNKYISKLQNLSS